MYLPSQGFLTTYHMDLVDDATWWCFSAAVYDTTDFWDPWTIAAEVVTYIPSLVVWRGLAALGWVVRRNHKLRQRIPVEAVEKVDRTDATYD